MNLKTNLITPLERTRVINDYLHDIRQYPVLTEKQEKDLIIKIKNGDEDARQLLIKCNLRFVFSIAKCYANDDRILDVVNEGNIGLMSAIDMYDVNYTNRFLSYAVWYIRRSIHYYLINDNLLIRKTNNQKVSTKLHNINNNYFLNNGRYPTEEEIMDIFEKEYGVKISHESDLYDVKTESINANFDDDESKTFENSKEYNQKTSSFNNYEIEIEEDHNKYIVEKLLSVFNKRDREIMELIYGVGSHRGEKERNFFEVGDILDLSSERIRQIHHKCITKMQQAALMLNK